MHNENERKMKIWEMFTSDVSSYTRECRRGKRRLGSLKYIWSAAGNWETEVIATLKTEYCADLQQRTLPLKPQDDCKHSCTART